MPYIVLLVKFVIVCETNFFYNFHELRSYNLTGNLLNDDYERTCISSLCRLHELCRMGKGTYIIFLALICFSGNFKYMCVSVSMYMHACTCMYICMHVYYIVHVYLFVIDHRVAK